MRNKRLMSHQKACLSPALGILTVKDSVVRPDEHSHTAMEALAIFVIPVNFTSKHMSDTNGEIIRLKSILIQINHPIIFKNSPPFLFLRIRRLLLPQVRWSRPQWRYARCWCACQCYCNLSTNSGLSNHGSMDKRYRVVLFSPSNFHKRY